MALVFVFGWNNSSFLIGNGRGSGSLTLREALLVSSVGLLLGVLLEGSKMLKSLERQPDSVRPPTRLSSSPCSSQLALTVALSLVKLPVSFSMVLVGAFWGAVLASSLPLDYGRLEEVVGFWVVAPLATALLAYCIMNVIVRGVSGLSLIALDAVSRYAVIVTSLAIAYVLGANNIGLIYGTIARTGCFRFRPVRNPPDLRRNIGHGRPRLGRSLSGTIGDRMLVLSPLGVVSTFLASAVLLWLGTDLAIPISLTQCLVGGMLGAAFAKQVSVVNTRLAVENVASWVVAPTSALILAVLIIRV